MHFDKNMKLLHRNPKSENLNVCCLACDENAWSQVIGNPFLNVTVMALTMSSFRD